MELVAARIKNRSSCRINIQGFWPHQKKVFFWNGRGRGERGDKELKNPRATFTCCLAIKGVAKSEVNFRNAM